MSAKTISLVRVKPAAVTTEAPDGFKQAFARNLLSALSAKHTFPATEGANKAERLANLLGANANEVGDWLTGRSLPDAWHLSKLCQITNTPADVLLSTTSIGNSPPLLDEHYHCITLHDEQSRDGYGIYTLPETLRHLNLPRSTQMLSVSCDDMAPMFKPGDLAIYDPRVNTVATNGIFVLSQHGTMMVRRIQRTGKEIKLLCENSSIPVETCTASDFTNNAESETGLYVVGRVLGRVNIGSFGYVHSRVGNLNLLQT